MQRILLLVFLPILFFSLTNCQKKKEKTILDNLAEVSLITLATTNSRCGISSASNSNYFTKDSVVNFLSTSVNVDRIDTTLPEAGSVEVYYPKDNRTNLPVIAIHQGGNVHSSFYSRIASNIASQGYVVYVANRCTTFFTQFFIKVSSAFSNEVYALAKRQNSDTSSPLFGRIDPEKLGFSGHSLGGVVALYALNGICQFPFCDNGSSRLSQTKVVVLYGSGLNQGQLDPSKIVLDSNGKAVPVAFIQGSLDGAYKPAEGQAAYANYKSSKILISLEGANHYSITDVSAPFGANAESNLSTVTQNDGLQRISELHVLLFNSFLKENKVDLNKLSGNSTGIQGVSVTSSL